MGPTSRRPATGKRQGGVREGGGDGTDSRPSIQAAATPYPRPGREPSAAAVSLTA